MDLMVRLSLQLSWLGEAYLLAGRPADALAQGTRALELARRYDERGHLGWALRLLGEVHRLSASDALAAENYYNEALSLAETLQMRVLEAHCRLGLGLLHQASDRKEEAGQGLRSSFRLYEQMGASTWLHRAKAAAGGID
jgi:tetratricopeptide (TPR) repeat protein